MGEARGDKRRMPLAASPSAGTALSGSLELLAAFESARQKCYLGRGRPPAAGVLDRSTKRKCGRCKYIYGRGAAVAPWRRGEEQDLSVSAPEKAATGRPVAGSRQIIQVRTRALCHLNAESSEAVPTPLQARHPVGGETHPPLPGLLGPRLCPASSGFPFPAV
ncbi:hypothetical protein Emag_000939 [Eimeria magna]